MFKAAKTVDFLFLTYYTDGSKQRKRLSSLIRLYFPLYLSRRSVSFSALRTERPINFLCRRRAAEWMIVMEKFDSLIIGEVAQDTNVDFDGTVVQAVGGAVYYSGCAAANMGHKIAVLPKADLSQLDVTAAFHEKAPSISVFPLNSPHSFVTKNVYHTADRERRTSTVDSLIAPYTTDEVPVDQIDAAIWHLAGLAGGDIPNEMIPFAAKHAMVAIDVQTMLRWVENGGMVYHDWKEKKELLPYIRFLKTDAAEAEILTGLTISPVFASGNLLVKETVPEESLTEGLSGVSTAGTMGASFGSMITGIVLDHFDPGVGLSLPAVFVGCSIPFALIGWLLVRRRG